MYFLKRENLLLDSCVHFSRNPILSQCINIDSLVFLETIVQKGFADQRYKNSKGSVLMNQWIVSVLYWMISRHVIMTGLWWIARAQGNLITTPTTNMDTYTACHTRVFLWPPSSLWGWQVGASFNCRGTKNQETQLVNGTAVAPPQSPQFMSCPSDPHHSSRVWAGTVTDIQRQKSSRKATTVWHVH